MPKTSIKKNLKICLIAISYGRGGLERTTTLLSKMLVHQGFLVTNVILTNRIDYDYAGKMFNLGKLKKSPDLPISRFKRFKKLKDFLKQENFDLIIDHRPRNSWMKELFYLKYIYKNQKLIYVIHNFMTWNYLTDKRWMAKKIIKETTGIVAVSNSITEKLKEEFKNIDIQTIYNPIQNLSTKKPKDFPLENKKYILFLGRLDSEIKNIPLLLEAYKKSGLFKKKIYLVLMGSGESASLQQQINELDLIESVQILSYHAEVGYYLQQAEFLCLSSKHEGFPMVLVEALSVGTPVVSVDCESGPKEIIKHEENGLLVPNHQPDLLAQAMLRMIKDENLYQNCKKNAKSSIKHLQPEVIADQWKNYLLGKINNN